MMIGNRVISFLKRLGTNFTIHNLAIGTKKEHLAIFFIILAFFILVLSLGIVEQSAGCGDAPDDSSLDVENDRDLFINRDDVREFKESEIKGKENWCPQNGLNVKNFGAFGDGKSHPLTKKDLLSNNGFNDKYSKGDEWDTVAIQEAINAATENQTVCIPKGKHLMYRKEKRSGNTYVDSYHANIKFKSNLIVKGEMPKEVIFTPPQDRGFQKEWRKNAITYSVATGVDPIINNLLIENITFEKIYLSFTASTIRQDLLQNIIIRKCNFINPTPSASYYEPYNYALRINRTNNFKVENCTFKRDFNHVGRMVLLYQSHNTTIQNSGLRGFAITHINIQGSRPDGNGDFTDSGRCLNTVIENNIMERLNPRLITSRKDLRHFLTIQNTFLAEMRDNADNDAGATLYQSYIDTNLGVLNGTIDKEKAKYLEDHGIYGWGMKNLTINGNHIFGNSLISGSIKVRNGEDITITRNMTNASFLLYTYDVIDVPYYFKNVSIQNNEINLESILNPDLTDLITYGDDSCKGLSYWRQSREGTDENTEVESNVLIDNNTIPNGCLIINQPAFGQAFTVTNNQAREFTIVPPDVTQSNNTMF